MTRVGVELVGEVEETLTSFGQLSIINLETKDLLLMIMWVVCLCLRKLIDQVVELISSFVMEICHHDGAASGKQLEDDVSGVRRQEARGKVPIKGESGVDSSTKVSTSSKGNLNLLKLLTKENDFQFVLVPSLLDSAVMTLIWPRIPLSTSNLWRMRRMSRRWKNFIGKTLEWESLEVVRTDNKRHKLVVGCGLSHASLNERLSFDHRFLQSCLVMDDRIAYPPHVVFLTLEVVELDDE